MRLHGKIWELKSDKNLSKSAFKELTKALIPDQHAAIIFLTRIKVNKKTFNLVLFDFFET